MRGIRNDIRITKSGKNRIDYLLKQSYVHPQHKTMLKAIKSRIPKNVSKADTYVLNEISKVYK